MEIERQDAPRHIDFEYDPHFEVANWSPQARIVAGAAGLILLALGQRTKGGLRQLSSFVGFSLSFRALLNKDLTQVIGTVLSPTIHLTREIIVDAPTDEILSFWNCLENYPKFMSFVRKVETSRSGNLLWEVAGPGGIPIRWESSILSWVPSGTLAWRSIPGSAVFNSGRVKIHPIEFDRSRVEVELSYALRAGGLGYAAVRVLGFDPRTRIESDLKKMKSLIEENWRRNQASSELSSV